ncbi:MAG: hypothetical protein WC375_00210 [Methanomassiliicoccales archaeon]|jgi:hypothetical protein
MRNTPKTLMNKYYFHIVFLVWTISVFFFGIFVGYQGSNVDANARAVDTLIWGVRTGVISLNTTNVPFATNLEENVENAENEEN